MALKTSTTPIDDVIIWSILGTGIWDDDRLQRLTDQGCDVVYDPPGDGNFQFSALAFVLPYANICKSAQTLRNDVIKYLREHGRLPDGYPMELFMDRHVVEPVYK